MVWCQRFVHKVWNNRRVGFVIYWTQGFGTSVQRTQESCVRLSELCGNGMFISGLHQADCSDGVSEWRVRSAVNTSWPDTAASLKIRTHYGLCAALWLRSRVPWPYMERLAGHPALDLSLAVGISYEWVPRKARQLLAIQKQEEDATLSLYPTMAEQNFEWTRWNTQQSIELIREHPCLWQVRNKNYKKQDSEECKP